MVGRLLLCRERLRICPERLSSACDMRISLYYHGYWVVIGITICIIHDIRATVPLHVVEATTDTSDMIGPNFAGLRDMEE